MTETLRSIRRDGANLILDDARGPGLPVVFQHGLGGDRGQTREAFPPDARWRRITLECRGHGGSEPGDPQKFSIPTFTDDVAAAIEQSGAGPVVAGGISMGAAIALRLAVVRPDLVRGLVLVRPAWVAEAGPANMQPNAEVGALLAKLPPAQARAAFEQSETAQTLREAAPDNFASLMGFFAREPLAVTAALLQAIAADGPGVSRHQIRALAIPTLVIGHERDAIHPIGHAHALAELIPGALLVEITPKATDKARYLSDLHAALGGFFEDFS